MTHDDPYHDIKPYHMAKCFDRSGNVSPLCAKRPRKLDLKREMWTIRPRAVTCERCKAILETRAQVACPPSIATMPS